jgi:hypothetical protein
MKFKQTVLLGAAIAGLLASSAASAEEQFIGLPSYRVGPYAAGGSASSAAGSTTCSSSTSATAASTASS